MCVSEEEKQMSDSEKKHIKFDVVIGNPPYQEESHGRQKTFMASIYNNFMDGSYSVSDNTVLITPARFLFNAGNTPHKWNKKMLNDAHFKVLQYFANSESVFPHTKIKGGVAVSIRSNDKTYGSIGVFIPSPELRSVLQKVKPFVADTSLSDIVFRQNKFHLDILNADFPDKKRKDRVLESNIFSLYPTIFTSNKTSDNDLRVFGIVDNKRTYRYIDKKYIDLSQPNLFKYKVFVSKSSGSGKLGEILSTPVVGVPALGHTRTFISIGNFKTKNEADALLKYVKSKFTRALLGTLKITQDNPPRVWANIPLQDFTSSSDIDWTKSVNEIDEQLYEKYNLSQKEIDFIETHVKKMN